MSINTPKKIALEALLRIEQSGYSNIVINSKLTGSGLAPKEKGLCTTIIYGTVERKITLDFILGKHLKQGIGKTDAVLLTILRMSLYQILYMEQVAAAVAIFEGVELCKSNGRNRQSGFVNGVLRSVVRDTDRLKSADALPRTQRMSVLYSAPVPLVETLFGEYDEAAVEDFLKTSLNPPPVFARVNTAITTSSDLCQRLESEGVTATTESNTEIIRIHSGNAAGTKSYSDGLFHVQDLSSMLCAQLIAECALEAAGKKAKRATVLDVCAAPGGKSFTIAQLLGGKGHVAACDIHDNRLKLITDGANRLKLSNIAVQKNDAAIYNENIGRFDAVLCDVPCSGLGVIRRKPEIKYKEIANYSKIQSEILKTGSRYVKPGSYLIYSTCTVVKRENEDIVCEFLSGNGDFKLHPGDDLPNGFKTIMPATDGGDGFFIARLVRS